MKGAHRHLLDRFDWKTVLLLQCDRRFNRRLRPATDGMGLHILSQDFPVRTQGLPERGGFRIFDRHGWRARETLLRQQRCTHAGHRAPAAAIFDHRRVVDTAHHLRTGAIIFSNPQRVTSLLPIQPQRPHPHRRTAQRIPSARGVIVSGGGV